MAYIKALCKQEAGGIAIILLVDILSHGSMIPESKL